MSTNKHQDHVVIHNALVFLNRSIDLPKYSPQNCNHKPKAAYNLMILVYSYAKRFYMYKRVIKSESTRKIIDLSTVSLTTTTTTKTKTKQKNKQT